MGQMIDIARPDAAFTPAYLADAGPGKPGIILIQEWWGLNDQIRSVADRLCDEGFTTLAPDLFRGRLASSADEANHLMSGLDFVDATQQDLRAAANYLGRRSSQVGVMGFCMGGALTVSAAVHLPDLAAAVCFYGIPPLALADPAQIKMPFLGHFALQDDWCTPAAAQALEQAMHTAGASPQVHYYQAKHGFFNQTRAAFDAPSAQLAWERTLVFLRQHLHQHLGH